MKSIKFQGAIVLGLLFLYAMATRQPAEASANYGQDCEIGHVISETDNKRTITERYDMTFEQLDQLNQDYILSGTRPGVGDTLCVSIVEVPQEHHDTAYQAYRDASEQSTCVVPPEILAGIGYVESVHGTIFGAEVLPNGDLTEPVFGPLLDGNQFKAIIDTDNGQFDGNSSFDKAMGPMQFLPESWERLGEGNPQNIKQAAKAATNHLCQRQRSTTTSKCVPSSKSLTDDETIKAALSCYNNSGQYRRDVLAAAKYYKDQGIF